MPTVIRDPSAGSRTRIGAVPVWAVMALAYCLCPGAARATQIQWVGPVGGLWSNAGNWNPASVPGAADDAVLNSGQIIVDGTAAPNTVTLGVGASLTIQKNASLSWIGGKISGNLAVSSGGVLNIQGSSNHALNSGDSTNTATLKNSGTVNWDGAGQIDGEYGATVSNSGVFNAQNDGTFVHGYYGNTPQFSNFATGSFEKTGGVGAVAFSSWVVNDSGSMIIQCGTVSLQGGAFLGVGGGGASFVGPGVCSIDSDCTLAGTITPGGALQLASGTLTAQGSMSGPGAFLWLGGTITGTLVVNAGAVLSIQGTNDHSLNSRDSTNPATVSNLGTVNWDGAGQIDGEYGATFSNTGVFNAQNDGAFVYSGYSGTPQFNNLAAASFEKTGGVGAVVFSSWAVNDSGSMIIQGGTVSLDGGAFLGAVGGGASFVGPGVCSIDSDCTLAGTITPGGALQLTSGTLTAQGPISGSGPFLWLGGTITGAFVVNAGAVLAIQGTNNHPLNSGDSTNPATISNLGTVNWDGAGEIDGEYEATINNMGVFKAQNDGNFVHNGYENTPTFNNAAGASFAKTAGTGAVAFNGWELNDTGSMTIDSGTVSLQGGVSMGASGAVTSFVGPGVCSIDSDCTLAGTITPGGALRMTAGTLLAKAPIAGPGAFLWLGGTITGVFAVNAGAVLSIQGSNDHQLNSSDNTNPASISNLGTINWDGAGQIVGQYGAAINNAGTFNAQNDGSLVDGWGNRPSFNNLSGGGIWIGAAAFNLWEVSNSGIMSVLNGTIDATDSFTQTASGSLIIGMAGLIPGTQLSQVVVGGAASLVGNLTVSFQNGFVPAVATSFAPVICGSITGKFAAISAPPASLTVSYNTSNITLTVNASAWAPVDVAVGSDNNTRVLWRNPDGRAVIWSQDRTSGDYTQGPTFGPYDGGAWQATRIACGADGISHVIWNKSDGTLSLWWVDSNNTFQKNMIYGPFAGWSASDIAVGSDNLTRILWTNTDGRAIVWSVDGTTGNYTQGPAYGPYTGYTAVALACGSDGLTRLVWANPLGIASLWIMNAQNQYESFTIYGPYTGWIPTDIDVGSDKLARVLWTNTVDGRAIVWSVDASGNRSNDLNFEGPFNGYTAQRVACGSDGFTRLTWVSTGSVLSFWHMEANNTMLTFNIYGPYF